MAMRVLIADRNARLLESISRTFAAQFGIRTATTRERVNELLAAGEFDLAIISEKLADGPGLQLLGQIARNSPDTLRILAARRSRLQLLKGKLGPFGLFRTLSYPIGPQDLLSALTLARSGLEVEVRVAVAAPLAPQVVRPTVERISLTSADAMFEINVPLRFAAMAKARRSNSSQAPRGATVAPQAAGRNAVPGLSTGQSRPRRAISAPPSSVPQLTRAQSAAQSAQSRAAAQSAQSQPAVARPAASQSSRRAHVHRTPLRSRVVLGATIVAVFLVTTLTVNLLDAGVHVTQASLPRPETQQPAVAASSRDSAPVDATPMSGPAPTVARRVDPKPNAAKPDVEPSGPQIAASTTPIADPSTFSSEAYEPIYAN